MDLAVQEASADVIALEGRGGCRRRRPGRGGTTRRPRRRMERLPTAPRRKPKGDTNEMATLTLTFRAVSLKDVSGQPEADKALLTTCCRNCKAAPS